MNKHCNTYFQSDLAPHGKSFRFLGEFDPHVVYHNNEMCQDFVTFHNTLYACVVDGVFGADPHTQA